MELADRQALVPAEADAVSVQSLGPLHAIQLSWRTSKLGQLACQRGRWSLFEIASLLSLPSAVVSQYCSADSSASIFTSTSRQSGWPSSKLSTTVLFWMIARCTRYRCSSSPSRPLILLQIDQPSVMVLKEHAGADTAVQSSAVICTVFGRTSSLTAQPTSLAIPTTTVHHPANGALARTLAIKPS